MGRTLLTLLLTAPLLAGCGDDAPRTAQQAAQKALADAARPMIGTPLPDFGLERLSGGRFSSMELRGTTTLLLFWAPWCPPCVQELSELARLHTSLQKQGAQVIGIALADEGEVRAFLTDHPLPFPILLGGQAGHEFVRQLGNPHGVLPYSVVIDAEGIIRAAHGGRLDASSAHALIKSVLHH